jgi:hypothetical protein
MKFIVLIATIVMGLTVLTGCGTEEPSTEKLNAACVGHGGVYHVERHERGESETYMYLFVCEDKTVQRVYP